MRSRAMSVTDLRTTILESDLSPTGENPSWFAGTKGADRQILADAIAAEAAFLITTDDVHDVPASRPPGAPRAEPHVRGRHVRADGH